VKHSMKTLAVKIVVFGLACLFTQSVRAQTVTTRPALASYDWSVNSTHSLASNPPPADVVQAFVNSAFGTDFSRVCEFRFADLRHSGNLSLVTVIDAGGTSGCNGVEIFDNTASSFESYSINASTRGAGETAATFGSGNLADSIQDINNNGNLALVLYGGLAQSEFGCAWPMIFAWRGSGYKEISRDYKGYYQQHLKSLEQALAAEQAQAPASDRTPASQTTTAELPLAVYQMGSLPTSAGGHAGGGFVPVPAASPTAVLAPEPDYDCDRIEAAKTEAFLGIHSDATMSYAIKASESSNPGQRLVAAVLFSFIGTPEAMADLKELAADSNPDVAKLAKAQVSYGQDPGEYYRQVAEQPVFNSRPRKH
jgi:hypothetical protein